MMKKRLINAMLILSFLYIGSAMATEIIHYTNIPVTIELRQGEERSIQFGNHVHVGITKAQQMKKLFRIQSAQGAVHILPYQEFDKQRIQIKRQDGRVILLDIIADKKGIESEPLESIRIVLDSENVVAEDDIHVSQSSVDTPIITPVDLTRFASQRLYGPTRLHNDRRGITETTLGLTGAIRIFKGENKYKTVSEPILAYQGGGYYLAAIHIKNISHNEVNLNYLDLNLPFSHATFQHHTLYKKGIPGDSTVLYLIHNEPWKKALYPWNYYQDLSVDTVKGSSMNDKNSHK